MKLAKLIGLLLTGALALSALGASSVAAAPIDQAAVQTAAAEASEQQAEATEEAAEAAEESAEKSEESAVSPMALDLAAKGPSHLNRIEGLKLRIERLKRLIAKTKATREFIKTLPRTTVRFREHKPRETARIKEYRAHIRAIRSMIHELKKAEH